MSNSEIIQKGLEIGKTKKEVIFEDFKNFLNNYNKISEMTKKIYFNSLKFSLEQQNFNYFSIISVKLRKN
jgi:hypothetical protein